MARLNILIVEDDQVTADEIKMHLEDAGHQVTGIARDYSEAMKLFKSYPPNLAIIDIGLGKVADAGISVAQDMLSQHWMSFIYLTSHSDAKIVEKAQKTFPSAYLLKPFRPKELLIQIRLAEARSLEHVNIIKGSGESGFYLPFDNGHDRVLPSEILFLEAKGSSVIVRLTTKKNPRMIGMTLGNLAQHFELFNFFRLSRSLYINIDHLKRIERTHIYMGEANLPVPISEANRKELLRHLKVIRTR